jgi:predicted Zn-dependent peptidase
MLSYTNLSPNFHLVTNLVPDRYKTELNLQYTSGGGLFETKGQSGVSHLLEHCILGRTKDKDFYQLKDHLFEKSIYNNAATGVLSMFLTLSGHRSDAFEMLDLMLEFGFNPTLAQDVLDREKEIVLREISERRGDPGYRLFYEMVGKVLEPGSRYLHQVLGDVKDVKASTLDTFYDLHRGMLERSHFILSISGGGLESQAIIDKVQNVISRVPKTDKTLDLTYDPGNTFKDFKYVPIVSKLAHDHAEVSIYLPVTVNLENRPARFFLQSLLLKMPDGELYNRLRNELGWIYSLQSTFDKSTSTLNLELSCEIKYISKIVDEVKKVFSDFEKVYSPKKAEILRQMTVKRQEMAQDEPQIITDFLVDNLSEFGVPLTYAEYVKKLALVTTEDIKALFDEIKTGLDKMRIVVTSNKKEVEKLVF